ncbi:hypothetical protein LEP1GSC047_0434 [Leptospira inadai serovar Lyme str. 10]|uniref:Lipoprotein n=2 Tax=Leptospira inadai serovar Lyme TaxID=293084 RepID=V6HHD3_9LEPT|nr:hypothetical protein [Leptospira inadai]EQA35745.1 hypothetical protein LEP1GSC047_0434 [Leptospira inadai serovar Lyme str. 10]PNV76914.1 hypothetical protein BES34_001160 [Leptospira inadai serovar Lyme]
MQRFFLNAILVISVILTQTCSGTLTRTEVGGRVRDPRLIDSATILRSTDYEELGTSTGESSVFFLFGLIPMTNPLNMDYALSEAVRKIPGGKTMVKVRYWHETHLFFPVGTVSILKVKGMVVGAPPTEIGPEPQSETKGDSNIGGKHTGGASSDGKK